MGKGSCESAEEVARRVIARRGPIRRGERRLLRRVARELERRAHGLTNDEWQAFLERLELSKFHYRAPPAGPPANCSGQKRRGCTKSPRGRE